MYVVRTANVLKFRTLAACQKGLELQGRPGSDASAEAVS